MSDDQIQAIIDDYLRQLSEALALLPSAKRDQLLSEIADHVAEARAGLPAETETSIREMLDRVGRPDDIASEAGVSSERSEVRAPRSSRTTLMLAGAAVLVVALIIGLVFGLRTTDNGSPTRSTNTTGTSTTPAPGLVTLPNVIGMSQAKAVAELSASGLSVATVSVASGTHLRVGLVNSQAPTAGSRVARGSSVLLTVSNGT